MPRRRRVEKLRFDDLTVEQRNELMNGPQRQETAFASEDARRAAWASHGAALLAGFEAEAVRPWAFWAYEPDVPSPLRSVGALTERFEVAATDLAWWGGGGSSELDRRRRAWLS